MKGPAAERWRAAERWWAAERWQPAERLRGTAPVHPDYPPERGVGGAHSVARMFSSLCG